MRPNPGGLEPLIRAALDTAFGVRHVFARDPASGQWARVTDPDQLAALLNLPEGGASEDRLIVYTQPPDARLLEGLLAVAFGAPFDPALFPALVDGIESTRRRARRRSTSTRRSWRSSGGRPAARVADPPPPPPRAAGPLTPGYACRTILPRSGRRDSAPDDASRRVAVGPLRPGSATSGATCLYGSTSEAPTPGARGVTGAEYEVVWPLDRRHYLNVPD